ncbi:MAG: LCP family protein, partial [Lachnospiraceae bacterium]
LNDLLGGVTVTLEDDFTAADPAMTKGATLTLTGEQAVTLVRRRMDVADGTNETRMTRQREFMDAAVPLIREKINESSGFITTMIDTLTPYVTTNMVRGRMINEINRAYHYEVEPVQYLSGEHSIGEDGFVEFHADEQSIVDFVLDAFYTKKE